MAKTKKETEQAARRAVRIIRQVCRIQRATQKDLLGNETRVPPLLLGRQLIIYLMHHHCGASEMDIAATINYTPESVKNALNFMPVRFLKRTEFRSKIYQVEQSLRLKSTISNPLVCCEA